MPIEQDLATIAAQLTRIADQGDKLVAFQLSGSTAAAPAEIPKAEKPAAAKPAAAKPAAKAAPAPVSEPEEPELTDEQEAELTDEDEQPNVTAEDIRDFYRNNSGNGKLKAGYASTIIAHGGEKDGKGHLPSVPENRLPDLLNALKAIVA